MAIKIIDNGFGQIFYDLLENTTKNVIIISPFISFKTADRLAEWLEGNDSNINCTVITRFNREEFIQSVNSIEGLERLQSAGAKMYALQHLHTKLYIFDEKSVIMGSANFTFRGFFKNHELGIFVKDELEFSNQCMGYFKKLLDDINQKGDFEITPEIIQNEKKIVNGMIVNRKSSTTIYKNTYRWGAVLDEKENEEQQLPVHSEEDYFDILEKYIEGDSIDNVGTNTGVWIKFEGNSESRIPNEKVYLERKKNLHEYVNRTYYHRPPRSVKAGDTVFIAMISRDREENETPMIVGYAITDGFNENNVINLNDNDFKRWNGRYPYYIEFGDGKFLNQPISNGISLIELCNTLKHRVYPKTLSNSDISINSILKRHHQKAHIQITETAKKYLIDKLDRMFAEHGYDKI